MCIVIFLQTYDSPTAMDVLRELQRIITLPWACIKQTRGLLPLATAITRPDGVSSDWPRGVTLPY